MSEKSFCKVFAFFLFTLSFFTNCFYLSKQSNAFGMDKNAKRIADTVNGSSSVILTDSLVVTITAQKDSVAYYDSNNKLLMKIFWRDNSVLNGNNCRIKIGRNSEAFVPTTEIGNNYNLSNSFLIEYADNSGKLITNGLIIRLYSDTSMFTLSDIKPNFSLYILNSKTGEEKSENFFNQQINYKQNYVEYNIGNIIQGMFYTLIAHRILMGDIYKDTYGSYTSGDLIIPANRSAVIHAGVNWDGAFATKITVNGEIRCEGTESEPVILNNLGVGALGIEDDSFINNKTSLVCNWTNAYSVSVSGANGVVNNCRLSGSAYGDNYSELNVNNTVLNSAYVYNSKMFINKSVFDSSSSFNASNSIIKIPSRSLNATPRIQQ